MEEIKQKSEESFLRKFTYYSMRIVITKIFFLFFFFLTSSLHTNDD
tara:strand:+ start:1362 stop:1499 length:138 start_codon:yes stop_codon:yes gene_type:complete